jgi:hypothetical protein
VSVQGGAFLATVKKGKKLGNPGNGLVRKVVDIVF